MRSNPILPWLRLCRLPTVFTALADIFAGFLLTRQEWQPTWQFGCLLGASAGLYLAGMVFNDVFDLHKDRSERPNRPIPSGAISRTAAMGVGSFLMIAGLICAGVVGIPSLLIAVLTAVAVLAYDGGLKKTPIGPVSMGTCRFFNILLGASSAAPDLPSLWAMPQLWVAISMGIYITGVTWFARTEARVSNRGSLIGALVVLNVGLVLLAVWMLEIPKGWGWDMGPVGTEDNFPVLVLWTAIAFSLNRRAITAISDPRPGVVQPAIGSMLLSVITIDAMVIFYRMGQVGVPYVLATLALIIPAILLRRVISMT
ncbi:UbiA family prenyltransferase [Planctomicrobium sp. SH668]|uniref:UbiA family prenyltransferase n=1 Tax=Planctomicrobium sp. SH668 TaxID=3448126 RepID=UPI003F5BDABE